ncbi:PAS domain-containing protein [Roseateles sp.]|uniref:PAS domain-containing protein n=1 Tax=Roseateles sp. TaxID=1971397 RepID=UPI0032653947
MDTKAQTPALRLQEAVDAGELGLWDLRPELETVHYSPQWKLRLGFPEPHRADSTHFWRCRVHPGDLPGMLTAMREHLSGTESTYEATFRLRSNGSGYRVMLSRGRVIEKAADGRATRMVGTMVDLTPRPCTPQSGLADGARGPMAGASLGLPFHLLLGAQRAGEATAAAAERRRVLNLVDDLMLATLGHLEALRAA